MHPSPPDRRRFIRRHGQFVATAVIALVAVAACSDGDSPDEAVDISADGAATVSEPAATSERTPGGDQDDETTSTSATAPSSTADDPESEESEESEESTGSEDTDGSVESQDTDESEDTDDTAAAPWENLDESGSTGSCDAAAAGVPAPEFESVELEQVGEADGVTVHAAEYPLPDGEGNPWSQWGEGVVLPDGRFVSGLGDHLGQDGTSWFYEYDPESHQLTRTVEVSEFLGHESGDWGYGKLHASMVLDECDRIIAATYWGSRHGLELGGSYSGDHLIRYDPATRTVDDLGVPVEGFGLPSLSISPDRQWVFGEAVDPATDPAEEPDRGVFFVADAATGEVVHLDERSEHFGFRDVLVTTDGEALYAMRDGALGGVRPDGSERVVDAGLPGGWLRSATPTRSDGPSYGVTRRPDALFEYGPSDSVRDLGELEGYVASIALSPDGGTLYYVPGAHGDGPELGGTPLIAVDTASGDRTVLARLNDLIEPALGVIAAGSYNVAADPSGERVYVGLNGAESGSGEVFGRVILAAIDLPS